MVLETSGPGDSLADPDDSENLARMWESLISSLKPQGLFDVDRSTIWWPKARDTDPLGRFV